MINHYIVCLKKNCKLITIDDLEKYDPSGLHAVYDRWAALAKESYATNLASADYKDIDHIVFAGMGGSGAVGDLFYSILSKSDIHVSLVKGYLLPKTVDKNTLVVTTSVSGNTEETLTILNSTKNLGCKVMAFSSGGKMKQMCLQNMIDYREIPKTHSPRASFIQYVYCILKVLNSTIPIRKTDIMESISELEKMASSINSSNLSDENPSLDLASWISGIPLIYYPHGLQAAAIRFKASLHENAKSHAMIEDIIEACHNGIVAWERTSTIQPILIRGKDDYIKTKERWDIIKKYFIENKIPFKEINSIEGNILSKILTLIYLLDYSSIYKAVMNKVDPGPVLSIDSVKSKLQLNSLNISQNS